MKQLLLLIISCLLVSLSCKTEEKVTECGEQFCTMEFRMVSVKFSDNTGKPVTVKDFKSVNKRTSKSLTDASVTDTVNFKGNYAAVTDANKNDISENGDTILVSARHPASAQVKQVSLVVRGGKCECHISKLAGPEEVVFD